MQPEALVILIHIPLSLLYILFIFLGLSRLRKEHVIPLFFIPLFGLFLALTIEILIRAGRQGIKKPDLVDAMAIDDDILWASLKSFQEKRDLVPLEEAVLINEVKIRRKSMLETLYADPLKFLSVLNTAKNNEDIETSHYATTTISKAQKDFQLSIQKAAAEAERHPDDPEVLDIYIDRLGRYIRSGLLEESLLRNFRIAYSKALDRKLALVKDDKNALIEKLRNAVEVKDFNCASEVSRILIQNWPEDEHTWIETLRVCVEGKDATELRKTIEEIQHREILWSDAGMEQARPWIRMLS